MGGSFIGVVWLSTQSEWGLTTRGVEALLGWGSRCECTGFQRRVDLRLRLDALGSRAAEAFGGQQTGLSFVVPGALMGSPAGQSSEISEPLGPCPSGCLV